MAHFYVVRKSDSLRILSVWEHEGDAETAVAEMLADGDISSESIEVHGPLTFDEVAADIVEHGSGW